MLIVEDIPLHRTVLAAGLKKLGFNVTEAATTDEAMDCLHHAAFHAVFLDWLFPEGTGEAVAIYLRDHHPQTRLVVNSADMSDDQVELYHRSGAHHILGKNHTLGSIRAALLADLPDKKAAMATETLGPTQQAELTAKQNAALKQELESLRNALVRQRDADAHRAAHNLHGVARLLQLDGIARISRELEIAIVARLPTDSRLAALEHALGRLPQSPHRTP